MGSYQVLASAFFSLDECCGFPGKCNVGKIVWFGGRKWVQHLDFFCSGDPVGMAWGVSKVIILIHTWQFSTVVWEIRARGQKCRQCFHPGRGSFGDGGMVVGSVVGMGKAAKDGTEVLELLANCTQRAVSLERDWRWMLRVGSDPK